VMVRTLISELDRVCGPQRSAARLQAGIRGAVGGEQATGRMIEVRLRHHPSFSFSLGVLPLHGP
jgi:hypothetical protein